MRWSGGDWCSVPASIAGATAGLISSANDLRRQPPQKSGPRDAGAWVAPATRPSTFRARRRRPAPCTSALGQVRVVGNWSWLRRSTFRTSSVRPLRRGNPQVATDLAGEQVGHLRMSRDGRPASIGRVAPPRVFPTFADQHASVPLKVSDEVEPLHGTSSTSSKAPAAVAAARASSRFISMASARASRRLFRSS